MPHERQHKGSMFEDKSPTKMRFMCSHFLITTLNLVADIYILHAVQSNQSIEIGLEAAVG